MFDVTLNAIAVDSQAPDEEQVEAGAPALVDLIVVAGTPLPFSPGPNQPPLVLPTAQLRFKLTKEVAIEYAQSIVDAAEKLPDTPPQSDLIIAGDVAGAEKLAKQFEGFSGGPQGKR